jgi:hypothetical protein
MLAALAALAVAAAPDHVLSASAHTGVNLYLSRARTAGGLGGGIGVRDTLRERWFVSADVSYLAQVGNAVDLQLGFGMQRRGLWNPSVAVVASALFGSQLTFMVDERTEPVRGPAVSLGIHGAPLKFSSGSAWASALELGVGAGLDFPGVGLSVRVMLLRVGASF